MKKNIRDLIILILLILLIIYLNYDFTLNYFSLKNTNETKNLLIKNKTMKYLVTSLNNNYIFQVFNDEIELIGKIDNSLTTLADKKKIMINAKEIQFEKKCYKNEFGFLTVKLEFEGENSKVIDFIYELTKSGNFIVIRKLEISAINSMKNKSYIDFFIICLNTTL